MLFWLTQILQNQLHSLRVFQYLTFRSILAALTSLLVSLLIGPMMIRWLTTLQVKQPIRSNGPQSHFGKAGTPTMGGILTILGITVSTLLWGDLSNNYLWVCLIVTLSFAAIGWIDDYRKLVLNHSRGLAAKWKYFWQSAIGISVAFYLYYLTNGHDATQLVIPFFKNVLIELGWGLPILIYFVIVGASNAVNLTDGLDGLAIVPIVMVAGALGIFVYASSNVTYAHYLVLPFIPRAGEVTIFCSAIVGAGLGFLWFNAYPAQIFMGDVGALSLGAALGVISVLVRQELVLLMMGGLFVAETLSVIMQVSYFKLSGGKRIFRMAPLHHHYELKGWAEPKVVVRFWIITLVLVLCGLATLKLR